jgi:AraC-like DNA-binding protein
MRTIFSTKALHPRERFDYWHSVACTTFVAHDSVPACRQSFQAELRAGTLSDIGIVQFQNASMTVTRNDRHMPMGRADELFVCRQVAGTFAIEAQGRACLLEPGDFTLLDPQLPYSGVFTSASELLVLKIPRPALEDRLGLLRPFVGIALKPARAENALTSSILAMLPDYTEGLDSTAGLVRDQVLDLLAISLQRSGVVDSSSRATPRALLLTKIRAVIDAHVGDANLHPVSLAERARVSLQYADALLSEQGTSVRQLILEHRLMKCREALQDPAPPQRTPREIAASCGFRDWSRFKRTFSATYGVSPEEFRRRSASPPG